MSKYSRFKFRAGTIFRGGVAEMDGEDIRGLRRVVVTVDCQEVTTVQLTMIAEEVDLEIDPAIAPTWGDRDPDGGVVEIVTVDKNGDPIEAQATPADDAKA